MSYLSDIKDTLRITHNEDDSLLKRLINSASYEVVRFLNIDLAGGEEAIDVLDTLPPDCTQAMFLLIQADYDGDPEKRNAYRNAAESLLMPYRESLGV